MISGSIVYVFPYATFPGYRKGKSDVNLPPSKQNCVLPTFYRVSLRMTIFLPKVFCFPLQMLLFAGAAVDAVDSKGGTALIRAAEDGHYQITEVRSLV